QSARSVRSWYPTLSKPAWTPPNQVFGPVWSVLYLLMGVASWVVWRSRTRQARSALRLFGAQLVLNVLWSALFFGLRLPGVALVDIVLLWGGIVATTAAFWRSSRVAAWLMAPYAVWTTFATALNFEIWRLNR